MKCPDLDQLTDALNQGELNPEMEVHLETCASCRANLRLLQEISAVFHPPDPVPEWLDERVFAEIAAQPQRSGAKPVPGLQVLGAGVLGFLTTCTALIASGAGAGGPGPLLLVSLIAGVACATVRRSTGTLPPLEA